MPKREKGTPPGKAEADSPVDPSHEERKRKPATAAAEEPAAAAAADAPLEQHGRRPRAKKQRRQAAEEGAEEAAGELASGAAGEREKEAAESAPCARGPAPEAVAGAGRAPRSKRKEKAARRREELAAKAAKNQALKKQGKLTRKEKYLAAKAAKKAQQLPTPGGTGKAFDLEASLAAAGLEKLDPRATSCFLTGLPYMATQSHVTDHFAAVGPCTVQLRYDAGASRSNGTGFVTFKLAEHALRACGYTGSKIQGRWIKVRLCEPRGSETSTGPDKPEEKPEGCLNIVIKYDKSVSEEELWAFFEECEAVNISCLQDRGTGEPRGIAFVDFEDSAMVDKAIGKNGQSIRGLPVSVRYKRDSPAAAASNQASGGRTAAHNRAPPVPPPAGTATKFDDSGSDADGE
ncbi:unnamed protein product [Prorocentrum cordatum]|uniref:RRM domain-containing protein n=1 Tax=Prorocentrum cordatum TaxID=2364126 RepID=A0ABN9V4J5_9DINO|nr:unnamed protein product [Polarella glacialis]